MRSKLREILFPADTTRLLLHWFGGITLLSVFIAIATNMLYLAGIPAVLLLGYVTIVDYKQIFYLLIFSIPLSTEIFLPNGLSTDLPTEPLIVGLMLVFLFLVASRKQLLDQLFLRHPITLLLLLHVFWGFFTVLTAHDQTVALKFMLAKTWYVFTFYFLGSLVLREVKDYKRFVWTMFVPLLATVVIIIIRHGMLGFGFDTIYQVLHPFYRNHVSYAAIMAVFIPFIWFLRYYYLSYSRKWWILMGAIVIILLGIQLSYTRAAYVGVFIAVGAYFLIRWKLARYALILSVIGVVIGLTYMANNNKYLEFAPNYETTIAHSDFNSLVEATYQLEDISTMERFYRWLAGFNMVQTEPIHGFGPGNFYFYYKGYTVLSFETYVSHNPEGSGIHNYYLMLAVEQGLPGLILFLALVFYAIIRAEQIYHREKDPQVQWIIMSAVLSLIVILALLLINDLIETDKIGSFFFIILALLVHFDVRMLSSGKKSDTTDAASSN